MGARGMGDIEKLGVAWRRGYTLLYLESTSTPIPDNYYKFSYLVHVAVAIA